MNSPEFISDISSENMLHAITIRSPIARGHITKIVCPSLPENYHLITAEQIPG